MHVHSRCRALKEPLCGVIILLLSITRNDSNFYHERKSFLSVNGDTKHVTLFSQTEETQCEGTQNSEADS
jgi:hypothetical protein